MTGATIGIEQQPQYFEQVIEGHINLLEGDCICACLSSRHSQ